MEHVSHGAGSVMGLIGFARKDGQEKSYQNINVITVRYLQWDKQIRRHNLRPQIPFQHGMFVIWEFQIMQTSFFTEKIRTDTVTNILTLDGKKIQKKKTKAKWNYFGNELKVPK